MSRPLVQILIAESDRAVSREIAALAHSAFPHDMPTVVASTRTREEATALIDRLATAKDGALIVICAATLDEGGRGLDVLDHARRRHPQAHGVVITSGEREEMIEAIQRGAHSVHAGPLPADALSTILRFLAESASARPVAATRDPSHEIDEAARALERALDAVEAARDAARHLEGSESQVAWRALEDAERLAVDAHRRALEAQRVARAAAPGLSRREV